MTKLFLKVMGYIAVTMLFLAAASLIIIRVERIQFVVITSDSMQPALKVNDLAVVKPAAAWPQAGKIISYVSALRRNEVITHRVQTVSANENVVITKGDNARASDMPIRKQQIIGEVRWHFAAAGKFMGVLQNPLGLAILVYLPAIAVIGFEIKRFVRKNLGHHYMVAD